jgi:putative colanic acid biosynthesis acetyltransferase WcaF
MNPYSTSSRHKVFWLRAFGAKIGKGVRIKPQVHIKYPWKLVIGNYCWIGEKVWLDNVEKISLGDNVCISQGAMLLTGSHDHTKSTFDYLCDEIVLEDGVWIGARSLVGKGVNCGSHCILGVNSVAEKDMDPFIIYKGNPAMAIMKRQISS